jgi:hypothetical protein
VPLARSVELFCLPCGGILVGLYAIVQGVVWLVKGKIPLTRRRFLQGQVAAVAGMVCVLVGAGLVWLSVWSVRFFPE